ncbi:MAG: hypothetical protein HYZ15_16685 [Sphingobacteriales bacterium]|nr:hypothetical protein [Sphingobacteriales bacterium]
MKKLYLSAFFIAPLLLAAQRSVDLDKYNFTVHYRSLPQFKLDSTYRTYHVQVEGTKMMEPFLQDLSPENSVMLEGWKKLSQDGHIGIRVKLGDLLPESFSVKERTESVKNISGVITGTRTYYHQEVVYSFAATASIEDYKGMHIMDQELASRQNKQVYNSPEFAIKPVAEGYFLVNSLAVTKDLYQRAVNRAMHYLSERISDNFGFREVFSNDYMWIIDSRKHPEYKAWREMFSRMSEVLFNMDANTPIEGVREQMKPVISYFEKIRTLYPSSKRHDRKIRYASYFNLAVLYYYLDDPQSMMKEANGLVLNDYDSRDGKGFEETAVWLKNLFQQSNIYTRHFPVNTTDYRGPNEKTDATSGSRE